MAVTTSRLRASALAGVLVGLLVLTGCTRAVGGTAVAAEPPGAVPTTATAAPTAPPADVVPAPPAAGDGRRLEAHRLAGATALVQTSFAERTAACSPAGPALTAADVESRYFSGGAAAILDGYGFVAAWGQCQQDPGSGHRSATVSIELSDPVSATGAAESLAAGSVAAGSGTATTVQGGSPAVLATDGTTDTAEVWSTRGRVLAYTFHEAPAGQGVDGATRLTTDQLALLQAFTPTPQADVPDLPPDPGGLAALALDLPGTPDPTTGPFDLESYIRIAIDPFVERDLLAANGFAGMYAKQATDGALGYAVALYAFPTSAQTNTVYTEFARLETAAFGGTPFELPALPEAPCFWFDIGSPGAPAYYQRCYVGYGSYLAGVDVSGVASPDDVTAMNGLLPAQRDLISA